MIKMAFLDDVIVEEAIWHAVVLIPKGGRE